MNNPTMSNPQTSTKPPRALGFFANMPIARKMGLLVATLVLGILGVTLTGYIGLRGMNYQLSNIYGFMLVPIVAINHADTGLADAQYQLYRLYNEEFTLAEQQVILAKISADNKVARDTIFRYDNEWLTTLSPEFTASVQRVGGGYLQEQEVEALANYHSAYELYEESLQRFIRSVQAGSPDKTLIKDIFTPLEKTRVQLQLLIDINTKFAEISDRIAREEYSAALLSGGIVVALGVILGLAVSYLIGTSITTRLGALTRSAAAMQGGNLDVETYVPGRDEVGLLGSTFNTMAGQLKELFASMEQRVAERTKALSNVAEISTVAPTIQNVQEMLAEVVQLTQRRFDLYHAHVFLYNEAAEELRIVACGWKEGDEHEGTHGTTAIPLAQEQSLVARAARLRKPVIVNDVRSDPGWLPNPLLPDTASELAVPLLIGEKVIGVLDVQSDRLNSFTEADANVQTTLASQIAIAVQNAINFTQAETSRLEAQSLLEFASEGILVVDLETGTFAEPNSSACKLYGLPREELVKVGPAQMSPPRQPDGRDSTEKAMEKINEAMQGKTPIFEWMHRNAQGEDFLCEIHLVRLPGAHPRVRATVTNITERKLLEEQTARRAREQEAINLITQQIQSANTIEGALQMAARELGRTLGRKETVVTLDASALTGDKAN